MDTLEDILGRLDANPAVAAPPRPAEGLGDILDRLQFGGTVAPPTDMGEMLRQAKNEAHMARARERAATMSEPNFKNEGVRGSLYQIADVLPGARLVKEVAMDAKYSNAAKRIAEGKGEGADFDFVAQYEKIKDIRANEPFQDKAQRALMGVPALAVEYMSGARLAAPVVRGLGLAAPAATNATVVPRALATLGINTAPQPAMYMPRMLENNKESGRDPFDLRGLPAAYALGMLNTAVLGRAQGRMLQPGSTLSKLPLAGRIPAAGVIGAGEAAGVDVVASGLDDLARATTGKSLELDTKYGAVGQMLSGDPKQRQAGWENAVISALTFAAFAGLHAPESPRAKRLSTQPEPVPPVMESFKAAVDAKADAGVPPAEAAKQINVVHDRFRKMLETDPANAWADARDLWREQKDAESKRYIESLAKHVLITDPVRNERFRKLLAEDPAGAFDRAREEWRDEKAAAGMSTKGDYPKPIQSTPVEPAKASSKTLLGQARPDAQKGIQPTPVPEAVEPIPTPKRFGLSAKLGEMVEKRVDALGSLEAVDKFYSGDSPAEQYGRAYARLMYKPAEAKAAAPVDAVRPNEDLDAVFGSPAEPKAPEKIASREEFRRNDDLDSAFGDVNAPNPSAASIRPISRQNAPEPSKLPPLPETRPPAERPTDAKPAAQFKPGDWVSDRQYGGKGQVEAITPDGQLVVRGGLRRGPEVATFDPATLEPTLAPLPEVRQKTAGEKSRAIKQEDSEGSMARLVREYGGIDPNDASFLAHYESMARAIEDGIPRSVFKNGGRGLDQLAQELGPHDPATGLKGGGYIREADPGLVLEMLKNREPHLHAEKEATHERDLEEYYRRQQEEANAGPKEAGPKEPASESDESGLPDVGETPPGMAFAGFPAPAWLMKGIDRGVKLLTGAGRGKDPAFQPDADPNPNNPAALPPEKIVKQAAANQLGARNTSPMELATTAWAWGKHAAEQIANAWGVMRSTRPDHFVADAKARDVVLDGGNRGYMADVIEAELRNPGSQPLTAAQRAEVAMWKEIRNKQLKAMDAAGVVFRDDNGNVRPLQELLDGDYFPRTTADKGEFQTAWDALFGKVGSGVSSLPGVKSSFRHGREHKSEADGVKAGTEYLPTFNERVRKFIRDSNMEIANARLANDPGLGGVDVKHKAVAAAMVRIKDALDALRKAGNDKEADDLERQTIMLAVQSATGNVHVAPAFRGKEYPEESKRWIETMYAEGSSGRVSNLVRATLKEMQGLVLSVDFSYTTLQLGKMMFRNPALFARTLKNVPQMLFNSQHFAETVNRSPALAEAMREIPQAGGSIGTPPEQAGAFGQGKSGVGNLIRRLPVVGKPVAGTYEAFGRTFGQVMDLAKLHLWAATKPADKSQWPRHIEAIENSLGQGRMEQLGMTPERAMIERVLLLAPSYYRSHLKLLQQMGQGGAPGRLARQQVGALAGGVMLTTIVALMALRKGGVISDEEFEERLNPERGKFLMVPVKLGNSGKTAEIGFGGFYVSMVRSMATSLKADNDNPTGTALKQWYRGHAGMGPRLAWDAATGRDYLGKPITPGESALRSITPLGIQQATGEGTNAQNAAETAGGLFGLRAFPASAAQQRTDELRKMAAAEYGKRLSELTFAESAAVVRKYERDHPEPKPAASKEAKLAAMENQERRQKAITKAVSPETRALLEEFNHPLPSYDPHIPVRGVEVPLSGDRLRRYEQLLAEEYDRTAGRWNADRLRALKPEARQAVIRSTLEFAKERAKSRLLRENR